MREKGGMGEAFRKPQVVGSGEDPQEGVGVRGATSPSCWSLKLKFDAANS